MVASSLLVHATTIAFGHQAVLLRGKPGSGKSSLALSLLEPGWLEKLPVAKLIADDQTILSLQRGKIIASAPDNLQGLLEVRGLGIIPVDSQPAAELALIVDLVPWQQIPRLPQPEDLTALVLGLYFPRASIDASLPHAASRLRIAFTHLVANSPKEAVARLATEA